MQKTILFFVLFLIVTFPMLQHSLPFFESGKINGAVTEAKDVSFSLSAWFDGSYQKQKELYLNDNTGCRPDLVRLNNEVDFRLFNKLHANNVVIGKDNYLYEKMYIDEYSGIDYMGDGIITSLMMKLKKVQDTLGKLGKTFLFVYAPSKARFFPDKFPSELEQKLANYKTNYESFKRVGDSLGVKQLDINAWFLGMKDTSKHLLFSRLGTHWTVYGSLLVCDSIIKYIERERSIRMPALTWNVIDYTEEARRTDADLAKGLNLISRFKSERFSYPQYGFSYEGERALPKAVYIGDSFLWTLLDDRLMQSVNKDWQVWYYFNVVWTEKTLSGEAPSKEIVNYNWQEELMKADYIVALYTPANFKGFNYDGSFIEQMYKYFYPGN
ncbi:MAG: sugar O-acetyltransferase precursor [Flavipsychrobacter sp.]|jgi:hypothetical protein|nr:sugar O-acetyltransferase precursor [Flavipsychrobacter sp.]